MSETENVSCRRSGFSATSWPGIRAEANRDSSINHLTVSGLHNEPPWGLESTKNKVTAMDHNYFTRVEDPSRGI